MTTTKTTTDSFIEKVNAVVYGIFSNNGFDQYHREFSEIVKQHASDDESDDELFYIVQQIYTQIGESIDVRKIAEQYRNEIETVVK